VKLNGWFEFTVLSLVLLSRFSDNNTAMNGAHTAVEWVFGDIVKYFKFLYFQKNLKVGLSAVGKMHIDCALIQNTHNTLYQSISSEYFDINPPLLNGYFI